MHGELEIDPFKRPEANAIPEMKHGPTCVE